MFIKNTIECEGCGVPAEKNAFLGDGNATPLCQECLKLYPHAQVKSLGQLWLRDVTPEMIARKIGEQK